MAKTLAVLVKVAAYKVEQAQAALAEAERALAAAEDEIVKWREEAANGLAVAARAEDPLLFSQAGSFRDRARGEEEKCGQRAAALKQTVGVLRGKLGEAFAAQKRYEVLAERQRAAALKKRQARQQAALEDAYTQKR